MFRVASVFFIAIAIVGSISSCQGDEPRHSSASPESSTTHSQARPDLQTVAEGNNRFALDLYARLRSKPGNLFLSPYSVTSAFGMVSAGAAGRTRDEIASAFHFTLPSDRLHPALDALRQGLERGARSGVYELSVANRIWGQKGFPFLGDFRAITRDRYGAEIEEVDFRGDPEAARGAANAWVAERTHDKIRDLFPPGSMDRLTRLALANAIYFKGQWALRFDPRLTRDLPFHVNGGAERVPVPTMSQTDTFRIARNEDVEMLELPYRGGDLAMLILLPRRVDGLQEVEAGLTLERFESWKAGLATQRLGVSVPRFTYSSKFSLPEFLSAMGMPSAFMADSADFSGMDGRRDLFLSSAFHQAFVEVNEEGTEAAAATGGVMQTTSMPPTFTADHPFLILIVDRATGTILFMGRVLDPRG